MARTYQNDHDTAASYAREMLAGVVAARNWSAGWAAVGEACILQAEGNTTTSVGFWDSLCNYYWFMVDETQAPGGWKELGRAYEAAYYGAWDDMQLYWTEASTAAVVKNTTTKSVDDAADIGQAAVDAADTLKDAAKSPSAWLLLLAAFVVWKSR